MSNSMNTIHCYIDQGLNIARPMNWTGRVRRQRRSDSCDMDQTDSRTRMEGRHTGSSARCGTYSIQTRKQQKYIFLYFYSLCEKWSSCRLCFFWGFSPWPPQYTRHNFFIFACVCRCICVCRSQTATSAGIFYVLSTHFFSIFEIESYRNQEVSQTSALLLMPGIVGWWEKLGLFSSIHGKSIFKTEPGPCRYLACISPQMQEFSKAQSHKPSSSLSAS